MVEREHVCTFQGDLFRPTLFKLGEVVERALSGHFKDVSCNVVECPDLRDFGLAREGLGGDPTYVECGGVHQSMFNPVRQRDVYTLAKVAGAVGVEDAFVLGAGAASATECSCCAELTVNAELKAGKITNKSKIARISDMNVLPETREITTGDARGQVGCICNLFYSSGGAGRVLEARARVRNPDAATSRDPHDQEFIRLVRLALAKEWPQKEKHVVLGGVLLVNKGKTLTHVMPPYFPPAGATPGKSFPDMKGWGERFFVFFRRLLLVRDPSGRGPSLPGLREAARRVHDDPQPPGRWPPGRHQVAPGPHALLHPGRHRGGPLPPRRRPGGRRVRRLLRARRAHREDGAPGAAAARPPLGASLLFNEPRSIYSSSSSMSP